MADTFSLMGELGFDEASPIVVAARKEGARSEKLHAAAIKLVRRAEAHAYEAGSPATFYDDVSGELNGAGSDLAYHITRTMRDLLEERDQ